MANEYVVDTDVVSYLFREDSRIELFRPYLEGSSLAISFMTIAELDRWALARNWGDNRRRRLARLLTQFTTILVDRQLCSLWAQTMDQARRRGRPI